MFSMPKTAATPSERRPPRRRARVAAPPVPDLPPEAMRRRADYLGRAVRERRVLQLLYGGAWRVVHPHALGRTGTGRLGLLTWQTAGVARGPGREGEGWRLFDVARIEDAQPLRATFTPRPRAPVRETWTDGIADPAAEVPTRDAVVAEAAGEGTSRPADPAPGFALAA